MISLLWCTWSRLCIWLKIDDKQLQRTNESETPYRDQTSSDDEHRNQQRSEEFFDDEPYLPQAHGKPEGQAIPAKIDEDELNAQNEDSDTCLWELSGLQLLSVRQLASLSLYPLLKKYFDLNQLLEIVDSPKPTVWTRMVDAMRQPKKKSKGK